MIEFSLVCNMKDKDEKKIWADDDKPWNIKRCQKKAETS